LGVQPIVFRRACRVTGGGFAGRAEMGSGRRCRPSR